MALVQWVGGADEVYVPAAGISARRGIPVEVPDDVAGSAPSGDLLGEGLLAQTSNWRPAAAPDGTLEG